MTEAKHPEPRILVCGEDAVVVEFGSTVDPLTNDRVYALATAIEAVGNPSVVELVPTYRSLLDTRPTPAAHQSLAQILTRLGRTDEALEEMTKAKTLGRN